MNYEIIQKQIRREPEKWSYEFDNGDYIFTDGTYMVKILARDLRLDISNFKETKGLKRYFKELWNPALLIPGQVKKSKGKYLLEMRTSPVFKSVWIDYKYYSSHAENDFATGKYNGNYLQIWDEQEHVLAAVRAAFITKS